MAGAKPKKVVILFPCIGRRVSLLHAFRRACRQLGLQGVMIGTDTTEYSAALQCCDHKYLVEPVSHRRYARQVTDAVRDHQVDLLIPTIDLDLPLWAKRRTPLARMGCRALVSSLKVVQLCQDKRQTYDFLVRHGFDTPATWSISQILRKKRLRFPYFLKPWDGHASRKNAVVHNRSELKFYAPRIPNCFVQEVIEGQEHTVDVFIDFDGKVRCAVPRLRMETRAGEVSKGKTVKHVGIIEASMRLVEALGAGPGVITIQCFLTLDQKIKFIEVNPRFGGGVPLSIRSGANFPRWILQMWRGESPRIGMTRWQEGLTMLRYDETVWYHE